MACEVTHDQSTLHIIILKSPDYIKLSSLTGYVHDPIKILVL